MRVLFVTPECVPLVKVGGLGDVSAALPAALRELDFDVRVMLPAYSGIMEHLPAARELASLDALGHRTRLLEARLANGVPLIVLDCPSLFHRDGGPYQDASGTDWTDNAARFGVFCKAAAVLGGASSPLPWRPDVIHLNDWPTALAAAYLHYGPASRAPSVLTVHNLAFQGNFDPAALPSLQLPTESYAPEGIEFHGRLSFLKAGLYYGNAITTVSPTYASEIQTESAGAGMQGLLQHRRQVLTGILNGIDTDEWNPASDRHLPAHYTADTLERKVEVKRALAVRLGFPPNEPDPPLLGFVGRLTQQKGADLIAEAAAGLIDMGARIVVLGRGEPGQEDALRRLAARHPGNIAVSIGFDETLAHLIEGGADLFLMPSRYEPCGLNQMYSQRYGTPPVAHATGGLIDTIVDCTPQTLQTATGFLFTEPSARALLEAVKRALGVYRSGKPWRALQRNGMTRDFSWTGPARQYAAVYRRIASRDPG